MTHTNSEISFIVDTMIVETLLSDEGLSKTAQAGSAISSLIDKVKGYVGNNINPEDKTGSLLNLLAPGAISIAFRAMGLGWLGILFGLAMRIFHIDVGSILQSIWDKLKSALSGGKQVSSSEVDGMVTSSVQEHNKAPTEDEAEKAAQMLEQKKSSRQLFRDAKLLKLAMIEFEKDSMSFTKEAASPFFSMFSSRKGATANLLGKVLGWVFKIAIASAGLMVAGDVVNKFLDRPNALDNTVQKGKPVSDTAAPTTAPAAPTSTQTKFKVNTSYRNEQKNVNRVWAEAVPNNESSIETMLVMFAKEVYSGLEGKEALIRSSPAFQVIKSRIVSNNKVSEGDNIVLIPRYFTSKKQIVDMFIDDVAEKVA